MVNYVSYARRYAPYTKKRKTRRPTPKTRTISTQTVDTLVALPKLNPLGGLSAFPREFVTSLRYCDAYTLTSTSNAMSSRQYMRMNSVHDPDQTSTGHQPLFYDQIMAVYGRYVVLKSRCKVTFSTIPNAIATSQPSGPMLVGIATDNDASVSSTVSTTLENSVWSVLGNQLGGPNTRTLYVNYSPQKDLGLPPTDDTVGAVAGNNPSAQWYCGIYCVEQGLASPSSVIATVTVDYTVRFSRLVDVSGS